MACVAFPTCGLAMAESERYLPSLISKIEDLLDEAGVQDDEITIRMTGCRARIAEARKTDVFRRGFKGERLNKLYIKKILMKMKF